MSRFLRPIAVSGLVAALTAALWALPAQAVVPMMRMGHPAMMHPAMVHPAALHGFGMPMRAPQTLAPVDPFMHRGIPPTARSLQTLRPIDPGISRSSFVPPGFQAPTIAPRPTPSVAHRVPPPAHAVVRSLPSAATPSTFLHPTPFSSLNLFPRPFGLASDNSVLSSLVAANIPPIFALEQGFGSPFFGAGFSFNPFLNAGFGMNPFLGTGFGFNNAFGMNPFFSGFNPVFGQTAFNASLAGMPFTGTGSFFFNPTLSAAIRPNLTAGLASGNPQLVANALGTLARRPNLFNNFANNNPFLIAGALGTLSASPNSFTGLVGTNPLIAGAFNGVASNPSLLNQFVNANPFVFANASVNPTLFNTLANANPAITNAATALSVSPLIAPANGFGTVNGFGSPFWGGTGWGGYNPYLASLYAGGYGLGGYGGGYGGGGGGMSAGAAAPSQAPSYLNQAQPAEQPRESNNILTAYGVPNDDGRIQWPVGLRVIGPATTTDAMRKRIDSLVETLLGQKLQYGRVDASIVQETNQALDALRRQLADRSTDLSFLSYQDSRNFLTHLQDAVKKLE